jgi:hypothetical protein
MGAAIDAYVRQRIPTTLIDELLSTGMKVEVHGMYPTHAPRVVDGLRMLYPGREFPGKSYNVLRPRLFVGVGKRVTVMVPPGLDYLLHNASLVYHHLRAGGRGAGDLRVIRYPRAEEAIGIWTGLADLVGFGDRLVMGYVSEIGEWLLRAGGVVVDRTERRYYGLSRVRLRSGQEICLLGVRFSFWGSISAHLAVTCQQLGVAEIIYAGKLGTLTSPEDIYRRILVPEAYLEFGGPHGVIAGAAAPPNALLAAYPELGSGVHMSVATVLEEDIAQRAYADLYGVQSIDNEIAKMAHALARAGGPHRTAFSAIHFATDYLRRPAENELAEVHNLTNHRDATALRGRSRSIHRIAQILLDYYENGGHRPQHDGDDVKCSTQISMG